MSSEQNEPTFQRCPHDQKNPYVMVSNNLIRDNRLTPECRWLLIFLLSNAEGWIIRQTHLVKHLSVHKGYGRDSIRNIIKEACSFGYMKMVKEKEGNLSRIKYYISESGSFSTKDYEDSKNVTDALNSSAPEIRPLTDRCLKKDQSSVPSEEEKTICKKESASPPSADAELLTDFFLGKIRERNPAFKEPNRKQWLRDFDLLLRIDCRFFEETKSLIEWAAEDNWWSHACLSPAKLRKEYDKMVMQKAASNVKNNSKINIAYAKSLKEKYPEQMRAMTFDSKFVSNIPAGKEVKLDMDPKAFREILPTLFGGRYVSRD